MPENIKNQLGAFKKFILRGNAIDLAVAFVIGAAFNDIVKKLVDGFITPLIALIGGQPDFAALNQGSFKWGDIINSVIAFIIMAAVIFFVIIQPLNKFLNHLKPADDVDKPAERQCPECLSAIPSAARRCKFCTAQLVAVSEKAAKATK